MFPSQWHPELPVLDPLDEELLDDLVAAGLRFITSGGAGFDGVDIDYLTSKGVRRVGLGSDVPALR